MTSIVGSDKIIGNLRDKFFVDDATLFKEVVLLAGDNTVEDEVDDEEHGGPVEARRVDLGGGALRAKTWHKAQDQGKEIEYVHDTEVPLGALLNDLAGSTRHVREDLVEAEEAAIVGDKDHDPVARDILCSHVKGDEAAKLI